MLKPLMNFLEVPRIGGLASGLTSLEESEKSYIGDILQKEIKTIDDAKTIYDKIKTFRCFDAFFSHNMRNLDMSKILDLCKSFKYERMDMDQVVFLQGAPSNDKVYVIISGEVAVVIGQKSIGQFGRADNQVEKPHHRHLKRMKGPKIFVNSAQIDLKRPAPSKKGISVNIIKEKRPPSQGSVPEISVNDFDAMSDKGKSKEDLEKERPKSSKSPGKLKSETSLEKPHGSLGMKKMKAFVRMVTAVRGMQKAAGTKLDNLKLETQNDKEVGTLQYLDEEEEEGKEDEQESDDEEKKEFEEYASKFGKIIRYLGKGDHFGELALKRNLPRSATIICKTDCEFLILEKQQYDVVFGKVQKEKEEFLQTVFPSLTTNISSSENYNFLMYFFKAETYLRGHYITREGKVPHKEARFYVIQHGECALEKIFVRELPNPYDRTKGFISHSEPVTIAILGKGSLIGEEILETQDTYEYSVKAISDTVLVQSISKRDYKMRFPKDFHQGLQEITEQKRLHREVVFEKAKMQSLATEEKYRNENIYCLKNVNMNNLVIRSAVPGLSRHIQRDNSLNKREDPILKSLTISAKPQHSSLSSLALRTGVDFIASQEREERRGSLEQPTKIFTPRIKSGSMEIDESKSKSQDAKIRAKLEFLSKLPETSRVTPFDNDLGLLKHKEVSHTKTLSNQKFKRPVLHQISHISRISDFTSKIQTSLIKDTRSTVAEKHEPTFNFSLKRLDVKDPSSDVSSTQVLPKSPSPIVQENPKDTKPHPFLKPLRIHNTTPTDAGLIYPSPGSGSRLLRGSITQRQRQESPSDDYLFITALDSKKREPLANKQNLDENVPPLSERYTVKKFVPVLKSLRKRSADMFPLPTRHQGGRRKSNDFGDSLIKCLTLRPILTERDSKKEKRDLLGLLVKEVDQENKENVQKKLRKVKRPIRKSTVEGWKSDRPGHILRGYDPDQP